MKCPVCGYINQDGDELCCACNSILKSEENACENDELLENQSSEQEKSDDIITKTIEKVMNFLSSKFKLLVTALGVLVLLALVVGIVKAIITSPSYEKVTDEIISVGGDLKDKGSAYTYLYNGKWLEGEIEAKRYDEQSDINGKVIAVLAGNYTSSSSQDDETDAGDFGGVFGDYDADDGISSTLYVVTKKGITEVDSKVESFILSSNGKFIAYTDEDGKLFLYNVSKASKEEIASDVDEDSLVISPNGKSVAFVQTEEKESDEGTSVESAMFVYNGKESKEIEKNVTPVALSDSCKYIYYVDNENGGLYITNLKEEKNKIASDVEAYYPFIINKDASEIIFTVNEKAYVSKKGGDRIKISNSFYAYPLLPDDAGACVCSLTDYTSLMFGVKTFANSYLSSANIIKLNGKFEPETLVSGVDWGTTISNDLKTAYYIKNDKLYCLDLTKKEPEPFSICDETDAFAVLDNGKTVYFLDEDETLWYAKGDKTPKKIADDVYEISLSHDDNLFYLADYEEDDGTGTLYASKKGGKGKQIAEDVYEIWSNHNTTSYIVDYDMEKETFTVYQTKSGTKFKLLVEDATSFD